MKIQKKTEKASENKPFREAIFNNRIKWLTIQDTAKYLGRSENAVKLLIYRGVLTRYKLGRRTYLRISEIDELIASSILQKGGR